MKKYLCVLALLICAIAGAFALSEGFVLSGISTIEDEAFMNDTSLETVFIPAETRFIGAYAFKNCAALNTVTCLSMDAFIGEGAFDCVDAVFYCYTGSTMEEYALAHGLNISYLSAFEIECDTVNNGCVKLPVTWSVVNAKSARGAVNEFTYRIYKEGTTTPVYTEGPTTAARVSYTPTKEGTYYAEITMHGGDEDVTLTSERLAVAAKLYIGIYEQNGSTASQDPLEWTVIGVEDGKALLITARIIKNESYFNPDWIKYKYTYWAYSYIGTASDINYRGSGPESTATRIEGISPTHIPMRDGSWGVEADLYHLHARYWCNNTFYNSTFSEEEKARILLSHNTNEPNPTYGTLCGPDTDDYVFFLSYNELMKYMPTQSSRIASQTTVAKRESSGNDESYWWLRTQGSKRTNAVFVYGNSGYLSVYGSDVGHDILGYRPCMWIRIGG